MDPNLEKNRKNHGQFPDEEEYDENDKTNNFPQPKLGGGHFSFANKDSLDKFNQKSKTAKEGANKKPSALGDPKGKMNIQRAMPKKNQKSPNNKKSNGSQDKKEDNNKKPEDDKVSGKGRDNKKRQSGLDKLMAAKRAADQTKGAVKKMQAFLVAAPIIIKVLAIGFLVFLIGSMVVSISTGVAMAATKVDFTKCLEEGVIIKGMSDEKTVPFIEFVNGVSYLKIKDKDGDDSSVTDAQIKATTILITTATIIETNYCEKPIIDGQSTLIYDETFKTEETQGENETDTDFKDRKERKEDITKLLGEVEYHYIAINETDIDALNIFSFLPASVNEENESETSTEENEANTEESNTNETGPTGVDYFIDLIVADGNDDHVAILKAIFGEKRAIKNMKEASEDNGGASGGPGNTAMSSCGFKMPLEGYFCFTSGFRTENRPNHNGVDLSCGGEGRNVYAAAGGRVVVMGTDCENYYLGSGTSCSVSSYGTWVDVIHNDGTRTRYAHLQCGSYTKATTVNPGDYIGKMGNTGCSSGPHLHFEHHNSNGPMNINHCF